MIKRQVLLSILFCALCAPAYSQTGVYLIEDFESGFFNPDYFLNCQGRMRYQSDMVRYGDLAASFEKRLDDSGKRCEMTFRRPGFFSWGDEHWAGFSFAIPYTITGFGVMSQHHSVPGPIGDVDWGYSSGANGFIIRKSADPTKFAIYLIPPGEESLNHNASGTTQNPLPGGASNGANVYYEWPIVHNQWFDVVLNFRYSDGDDGFYKVWINGEMVIDVTGSNVHLHDVAGRLKEKENYMQFGVYPGPDGAGKIFYDEIRLGDETSSYADVAPRVQPLGIPSVLTAFDSTATTISFSWNPSTEYVGVAEYDIYRDGTYVGTVSTNAYTDSLLTQATTYSFTVKARDMLGNETILSDALNTTTLQEQIITISPIPDKFTNSPPFDVEATATSGLLLTYDVSGPAAISDNTITLDGTAGTVEVTVTQAGDSTYGRTSKTTSFEVMLITGLLEDALPNIKIYPIPATDWIKIEGDYSENAMAQIIDIMGKQVLFQRLRNNRMSVSSLPEGAYILNISDKGVALKAKIIVQR